MNHFFIYLLNIFKRLGKREQFLVILLLLALVFNLYLNKLLKPQIRKIGYFKSEIAKFDRQIAEINKKMPDINQKKKVVDEIKSRNFHLMEQLAQWEKKLSQSYRIPQLLRELAKQGAESGVDFIYIRPQTAKEGFGNDYMRVNIELQFNAAYKNFAAYLVKLETLSSYLSVSDLVVQTDSSADFSGQVNVTLMLSSLLLKDSRGRETIRSGVSPGSGRNVFFTSLNSAKQVKYKLSGITFSSNNSTAIINDAIYKRGDVIDQRWQIDKILPNMVIIRHGDNREALILKE